MEEDKKLFAGWRNQDWVWVVILLIYTMILMVAWFFNSDTIALNFSIISSAVSIALASVAIFIALKQDSDNQRVNYKLDSRLEQIVGRLKNVDGKVDNVVTTILTNVAEETADKISDDLIEKKDHYSKEEVEELLNNYNSQIKDTLNKVVNQSKSNHNDSRKIELYGADVRKMQDALLKFPAGQVLSRKELFQLMKQLEVRSTPGILIDHLTSNGFLEIVYSDGIRTYIIKGF